MILFHHAAVAILAVGLGAGCAEHIGLLERGPAGGRSPFVFWPPPPPTSVWTAAADGATFGEVANEMTRALNGAGYTNARRYPIGLDFAHGFAFATQLEQIESDGSPARARWSSLYSEASNLRWLEAAHEPRLPSAGHFRVFLVAFTDLPLGRTDRAPRWNEETVMDAPDLPAMQLPAERLATSGFRVRAFVYEYAATSAEDHGEFVANEERLSAAAHIRSARLMTLAQSP